MPISLDVRFRVGGLRDLDVREIPLNGFLPRDIAPIIVLERIGCRHIEGINRIVLNELLDLLGPIR